MQHNYPRVMQRWVLLSMMLVSLFFSGCAALPPVVSQMSWALSGVSYVTTSKGPSDHVISYAAKKDCSLFRLVKLQPICRPLTEDSNKSLLSVILEHINEPSDEDIMSLSPQVASVQ